MDDAAITDLNRSQKASLIPDINVNRRLFGVGALGAGFALAAQPVTAETIITDAKGLTAGDISIKVADRSIGGYRAYPAGKTGAPVVLVVHEIFGVHEHIKDICRRLAHAGYYAISPDLYARYGDAAKVADIQALIRDIVGKAKDDEIRSDLDSTIRFAAGEKADTKKLAITGFCWGGRVVWKYTAMTPAIKAGAAWYGPLASVPAPSPADLAAQMKGRVIGFYGGKDNGISPEHRDAMTAALKAAGDTQSHIVVFPNAQHGFNADYRPSYSAADAKDAWGQMLAWFKSHGVA